MVYNATDTPDLSNVTNMSGMFAAAASFNGAIGNWDVSNVENMSDIFVNASSFDQDLGSWNIGSVTTMSGMLDNSGMSTENLNSTLIGWYNFASQNNGPTDITLGLNGLTACGQGAAAAFSLDTDYTWEILGATLEETCN